MKIKFIGTSHGYPEKNRKCSCAFIYAGEKVYVIDAGAPLFSALAENNVEIGDIGGIFITHDHDDHYMGLIEFSKTINRHRYYKKEHPEIYVPKRNIFAHKLTFLSGLQLRSGRVRYFTYSSGVFFNDGTLKMTAVKVHHTAHSYAFIVEAEGKKVMFSGDLKDGMSDYPSILYKEDFDILVLEAAHTRLNSDKVLEKVNHSKIKGLLVNHVSPYKNPDDDVEEMFKKVKKGVRCELTQDNLVIEL